ncbi:MAG: GNAT family N-acetyltransferase [Candidatus Marinimicrobia bacterium]|nr:GNAT family N-acetyltransferase [Candidatus Neomarinimicrobiota bacterium]
MEIKKNLQDIMNKEAGRNIAFRGFFDNNPVVDFDVIENSAIFWGNSDHLWAHLVAESPEELYKLLKSYHRKTPYYYSVEDWMIPIILKFGEAEWIMPTNRYILNADTPLPGPAQETEGIDISQSEYLYINSDYQKYISIEYIRDRLQKDVSAGVQKMGQLAAWGLTHDDGAIGFLHVLEYYRKQGLGETVLLSLIQQKRRKNMPVFCNIVPENKVSVNLVTKTGFRFDRSVTWLKINIK